MLPSSPVIRVRSLLNRSWSSLAASDCSAMTSNGLMRLTTMLSASTNDTRSRQVWQRQCLAGVLVCAVAQKLHHSLSDERVAHLLHPGLHNLASADLSPYFGRGGWGLALLPFHQHAWREGRLLEISIPSPLRAYSVAHANHVEHIAALAPVAKFTALNAAEFLR